MVELKWAYLHSWKESVEDPLSGEEGVVGRQLVRHGPRLTDGPYLKEKVVGAMKVTPNILGCHFVVLQRRKFFFKPPLTVYS